MSNVSTTNEIDANVLLGKQLYDWYGDSAEWRNFLGDPMPNWEDLPEKIRTHWCCVAEKVVSSSSVLYCIIGQIKRDRDFMRTMGDTVRGRNLSLAITKLEEALLWLEAYKIRI